MVTQSTQTFTETTQQLSVNPTLLPKNLKKLSLVSRYEKRRASGNLMIQISQPITLPTRFSCKVDQLPKWKLPIVEHNIFLTVVPRNILFWW